MKRAIHLSIVLLSLVAFRNVFSQDDRWIYIGSNEYFSVYLDKRTVSYGDYRKSFEVWTKWYCLKDCLKSQTGKTTDYIMTKTIYDCEEWQFKELQNVIYYADGSSYEYPYAMSWEAAIPDSIGEGVLEYVCNRYK